MWVYNSVCVFFYVPYVYLARGDIYHVRDGPITRVLVGIAEFHIPPLLGTAVRVHLLSSLIDHLGDVGIQ